MKVIIAGSRDITNLHALQNVIDLVQHDIPGYIEEVVSGTARGVDRLGEQWAERYGVSVKRFPADWGRYGKSAGYRRNSQMAAYADAAIILWDGKSRGTQHMVTEAMKAGLRLYVFTIGVSG